MRRLMRDMTRAEIDAMTPEQRELARHALGLPNNTMRSYRNRFLAAGANENEWREMTRNGYARIGGGTSLGTWFCLTSEGARAVLLHAETLDWEDFV